MKITIDIPDQELASLMRFTKAETKQAAIVRAVDDFNRRHRMAELAKHAGTLMDFMGRDDLRKIREDVVRK